MLALKQARAIRVWDGRSISQDGFDNKGLGCDP
jgi:hypothetical protein